MDHAPADIGEGARWLEADRRVEGQDLLAVASAYAERISAQPDDQELPLAVKIAGVEGRAIEADRLVPLALLLGLIAGLGQGQPVGAGRARGCDPRNREEEQKQEPEAPTHDCQHRRSGGRRLAPWPREVELTANRRLE